MNNPLFCLAIIMLLLTACRQQEDLAKLKAINQSLENANKIIQEDNTLVWEALREKRRDPRYSSYGEIWEPRASRIKKQADSIVVFIEELKSELIKQSDSLKKEKAPLIEQLYSTDGAGYKLVSRLAAFKDSFPAIIRTGDFVDNPTRQARLKEEVPHLYSTVPLLTGYTDSLNNGQHKQYAMNWLEDNFSGISPAMALVVLSRIENELLTTTKAFMDFCLDQTAVLICGWPGRFSAVAGLNSSYVKKGQAIEVTAGIGEFSAAAKPQITMNGKEIQLDNNATAVYRFVANGKPGKHRIKVMIQFNKPDGTRESVYKWLDYIIAD